MQPKQPSRWILLPILIILITNIAQAQQGKAAKTAGTAIDQKAAAILPQVIEWRRYLHLHPELSNREYKTAEYIAAHLKKLGLEVQTGIAKTGIVAILRGGQPGPVVALRADMDALPVKERVDVPFKSTVRAEYMGDTVSVMHACGHDSHVAMLMGAAEVLSSMKKDVPGTVKFFFQPAGGRSARHGGRRCPVDGKRRLYGEPESRRRIRYAH